MTKRAYSKIAYTPSVRAVQAAHGTQHTADRMAAIDVNDTAFSDKERSFIQLRDSFYVASVGENGWPYVQHRGGPVGFLKVLDEQTLGFADFRGNKQYITQGHLTKDNRVALFLMDYPHRRRLKIYARADVLNVDDAHELSERVVDAEYPAQVDRIFVFHLEAFDWNCPQHITPRWTEAEIENLLQKPS